MDWAWHQNYCKSFWCYSSISTKELLHFHLYAYISIINYWITCWAQTSCVEEWSSVVSIFILLFWVKITEVASVFIGQFWIWCREIVSCGIIHSGCIINYSQKSCFFSSFGLNGSSLGSVDPITLANLDNLNTVTYPDSCISNLILSTLLLKKHRHILHGSST